MQLVTSQFEKNDKSAGALTARNQVLRKEIDAQKEKIATLKAALDNAASSFGENDRRTQNWQIQLNKAQAELNGMERELAETADDADDLGDELTDSGKSAEDAGGRFEKLGGILKGIGAAMGAVAAAAGAAALKLGKEVVQQFAELEQNLGGSEAVFGEYAASIQKTGEDAYRNLGVSQSEYLATANKMGALFQGVGVDQQKSLELTEKAMQRAADMASVMGIDTSAALEAVTGAAKGNFTMMDNLGVAMNATSIQAYALSKGLNFTWSTATQAEKAEVAMQMFFESTQQYAGNFAREATQTVSGSIGLLKAALSSFTAGLGNVNADMTNLTRNLVDAFQTVVANIVPVLQNVVSALPAAAGAILTAIGGLLPMLLNTVTALFSQMLTMILSLLPELIPAAVNAVLTITGALIDNLPLLISAAVQMITTLIEGIGRALPNLIPAIIEAVLLICETLLNNMDKVLAAAFSIIKGLAEGLIRALPKLIEALPKLITGIVNFITQNLPALVAMGIELTVQLALGLIQAIPQLIAALPKIIAALLSGLGQAVSSVVEIGKNVVNGLWEGIKSMASWLTSKVRDFFSSIVKSAKRALGIASPSKVFAGIGENMGEGVGVGFTGAMEDVNKQIQNAIPSSVDVGTIDVLTKLPGSISLGGTNDLLSQKLDVLISEVRRYLPQLAGMQLVADTGATIGWLAPAMDDALGAIRKRKERLT